MKFSDILRDARTARKLSVYRLSKMSGVSESSIRYYEAGGKPTLDKADALLKALGTTMTLGAEPPAEEGANA